MPDTDRVESMLMVRATVLCAIAAVVAAACIKPGAPDAAPLEFSISDDAKELAPRGAALANVLVCTDSLGQPMSEDAATHCVPCVPLNAQRVAADGQRHARRVWQQIAKAPYNSTDNNAQCVRLSYEFAMLADSIDPVLRREHAIFQLASADAPVRLQGLATLDSLLDHALVSRDTAAALRMLHELGMSVWERAQRMHVRPERIALDDREKQVHQLGRGARPFVRLPTIPSASDRIGASEARWTSRIFDAASALATADDARARYRRLAMAPFVMLADWQSLDSAALALLKVAPRDSVAGIAHALAMYKLQRRSLAAYRAIERAFNEAMQWMPRADSASYDNFDDVFTAEDDEWRYGFLPGVRQQLDRRAWAIVDPLWSTPVNELLLTRRARKAEADFRYADITRPGQSGSETYPGMLLVKGGLPYDRWIGYNMVQQQMRLVYAWGIYRFDALLWTSIDMWRVFYGDLLSSSQVAGEPAACGNATLPLVDCARKNSAAWREVVFHGMLDTIDVTLSRFRARNDSVDLYVGARIPMRGFRHRNTQGVSLRDSVTYGLWISSSFGNPVHQLQTTKRLPAENEIAWFDQWHVRIGSGNIMHRVEAVDYRHARGARGAALLTSADAAIIHLSGFGVSDVLAAEKITPTRALLNSWRDLEIVPNGGVVAPRMPIALAWEIYDLERGPDGLARWRVHLKREDGTLRSRFDAQSLIIGAPTAGTQVVANEPDASGIAYTRTEPARPTVVEFLSFNLSDATPGRHVLILTIDDLVAKRTTQRAVSLRILPPASQWRNQFGVWPASVDGFRLTDTPNLRFVPAMRR